MACPLAGRGIKSGLSSSEEGPKQWPVPLAEGVSNVACPFWRGSKHDDLPVALRSPEFV